MLSAGYDVQLDVLNATVAGVLQNSSLPAIEVMPPAAPTNSSPSALLMTLAISSDNLTPFNLTKQHAMTGILIQVL